MADTLGRVLVVGASGRLGHRLLSELRRRGIPSDGTARRRGLAFLRRWPPRWYARLDLRHTRHIAAWLGRYDTVVTAAHGSRADPENDAQQVDSGGIRDLIDAETGG